MPRTRKPRRKSETIKMPVLETEYGRLHPYFDYFYKHLKMGFTENVTIGGVIVPKYTAVNVKNGTDEISNNTSKDARYTEQYDQLAPIVSAALFNYGVERFWHEVELFSGFKKFSSARGHYRGTLKTLAYAQEAVDKAKPYYEKALAEFQKLNPDPDTYRTIEEDYV